MPLSITIDPEDIERAARALEGRGVCELRPATAAPPGRLTIGPLELAGAGAYIAITWVDDDPDPWGHTESRRALCPPDHARHLATQIRDHHTPARTAR